MNIAAIQDLIIKMADDALIIGHRNSEWTGIGPILEEDLAFSSMSQDKIGHALALYTIAHEQLGAKTPDYLGFLRPENEWQSCQLVELPIGEYDFSIARQFLFDNAELIRYENLAESSYAPLAALAQKVKGEIKYHVMHGDTFFTQLAKGNETAKARMQSALNYAFPYALGIFEPSKYEDELVADKVFMGERALAEKWYAIVKAKIENAGLVCPPLDFQTSNTGGRNGYHTEYLAPLLAEMSEVTRIDVNAEW